MSTCTRTDAEILDRMSAVESRDFFGAQRGDLGLFLSFEAAKPMLSAEYQNDPAGWDRKTDPAKEVLEYMPFAWGKANSCRGLSSARSIDHMRAWLWLDGKEDLCARFDDLYEYYGKPCLVLICHAYAIDWQALDDGEWRNDESGPVLSAEQALKSKGHLERNCLTNYICLGKSNRRSSRRRNAGPRVH
jgi:hypothetical protein